MRVRSLLLPCIVSILAANALGQISDSESADVPNISMADAYHSVFSRLFLKPSGSRPDSNKENVVALLTSIGLDDVSSDALYIYVRDALAELDEFAKLRIDEMCDRRADIESKEEVADAFEAILDGQSELREQLYGEELSELLGERNSALLSGYVTTRATGITSIRSDPHAAFARSPESVDELLERICEPPLG